MTRFLTFLRSIVWTSVLAVAAIVAALIVVLVAPTAGAPLALVLSLAAVALSLLSRE